MPPPLVVQPALPPPPLLTYSPPILTQYIPISGSLFWLLGKIRTPILFTHLSRSEVSRFQLNRTELNWTELSRAVSRVFGSDSVSGFALFLFLSFVFCVCFDFYLRRSVESFIVLICLFYLRGALSSRKPSGRGTLFQGRFGNLLILLNRFLKPIKIWKHE